MNNVRKLRAFFNQYWFGISSGAVVALGALLRFYNYGNRWGLAFDQAHDTILAQYAITMHKLPLLGPFSSAGPFQTGGEWYWFIMLGRLLFPYPIQGPWILLTLLQVFFVALIIFVGNKLGGKGLGLFAGILAAISPVGIAQAINLTNQSLLNIIAALLILFSFLYFQTKKDKYLFLMGIFTTIGATIHLQGVPLVIFSLLVMIFGKVRSKRGIVLFLLGAILPLIPNIYSDYIHKGFNAKNMLQYYLHDQYNIPLEALGRRWTTYLDFLWPTLWGNVIAKNLIIGYFLIVSCLFLLAKAIFQRKIKLQWFVLALPFLIVVIVLKNVRTPIFDSYIMFLHPFIFLMSAAAVMYFFRKNAFFGVLLATCIVVIALKNDLIDIKNATNWSSIRAMGWTNLLTQKYPGKKFALYDYKFRSTTESGPLVMYLQYDHLLDDNGYKIGFGLPSKKENENADYYLTKEIKDNRYGFALVDLNSSSSAQLSKEDWGPVNPSYMYTSQEEWYK